MKLFKLLPIFAFLLANIAQAGDKVVGFSESDPEMNAAIEAAISTLDQFFVHYDRAEDQSNFGLKVAFDVDTGGDYTSEIIWINPVMRISGTEFTGLLANEPNWMDGVHFGDQANFTKDMIADWYIREDGKAYGYYTIRVLVDRIDEDQASQIRAVMQDEILPPYFND